MSSSRGLARKREAEGACRVVAVGHVPHHRTLGALRRRPVSAFKRRCVDVVRLASEVWVVHFGQGSIAGPKGRAYASQRQTLSDGRRREQGRRWEAAGGLVLDRA